MIRFDAFNGWILFPDGTKQTTAGSVAWASRAYASSSLNAGVAYYNDLGYPIMVTINAGNGIYGQVSTDSVTWYPAGYKANNSSNGSNVASLSFPVTAGWYFRVYTFSSAFILR